jgi:hypothetical protein
MACEIRRLGGSCSWFLHHQDWTRRVFHDSFGGAANEQAGHPAAAVRADYNEVDIEMFRHRDNLIKRVPHANIRLYLYPPVFELLFERCQTLPRCLLSVIYLRFDLVSLLLSPGKWGYYIVRYLKNVQKVYHSVIPKR